LPRLSSEASSPSSTSSGSLPPGGGQGGMPDQPFRLHHGDNSADQLHLPSELLPRVVCRRSMRVSGSCAAASSSSSPWSCASCPSCCARATDTIARAGHPNRSSAPTSRFAILGRGPHRRGAGLTLSSFITHEIALPVSPGAEVSRIESPMSLRSRTMSSIPEQPTDAVDGTMKF
jgi:hypothetical protein